MTTPRTSRCSWPRRPASRRATSRPCSRRSWPRPTASPSAEIAGPGFLNIRVEAGAQGAVAAQVVEAGASYGTTQTLAGTRFNVEFISANPTGPIHLGHTRWAVVGDAIARVLEAAGAEVAREFYINDRGNQMDKFGASLEAVALGRPVPEDGYLGDYVHDLVAPGGGGEPAHPRPARGRADGGVPGGGLQDPARRAAGAARWLPDQLRRLVLRAEPARRGQGRQEPGQAPRPGPPVRRRRRALDADHRLRRRQGPGARPVQRRADLLRLGRRLLRRQARAGLRRVPVPARRRPPRVRRPAEGHGRVHRGRPRARRSRC